MCEEGFYRQDKNSLPTKTSRLRLLFLQFGQLDKFPLYFLVLVTLILHFGIISQPSQMMFDENHYIPEAISFIQGDGLLRPEHAPLAKWFIGMGIFLFGDNAFGWRIFSVVFGIASIIIFYLICLKLSPISSPSLRKPAWLASPPIIATFLFSMDNLSFVQAGTAMLDVYGVTFMLLAFLFYLKGKYIPSGILLGLSALCKLTGVFAVFAILLHWILVRRRELRDEVNFTVRALQGKGSTTPPRSEVLSMLFFFISMALTWVILLPLLEYPATHQWMNPVDRSWYMLTAHLSLKTETITIAIASHAWEWVLLPKGLYYCYEPTYLGAVSWTIWGLIIPSMGYLVYNMIRRRSMTSNFALFSLCWFFGTYLILIPLEAITGRIMYAFYFYSTVPAVCMSISCGIDDLRRVSSGKLIFWLPFGLYLLATVAIFIVMSPYWAGMVKAF